MEAYRKLFSELKRYVRFSRRDVELLNALHPHAEPHFERIARAFYERNREHDETYAVFVDEAQIQRLHGSMIDWLGRILSGSYGDNYCDASALIGKRHVAVGLPQRFMFCGMTLIRIELSRVADAHMAADAPQTRAALARILDIELAIAQQAYSDAQVLQLQRLARGNEAEHQGMTERDMLDCVDACVCVVDASGGIVQINRAARELCGYDDIELIGVSFYERLLDDRDRDAYDQAVASQRGAGGAPDGASVSLRVRARSGRVTNLTGRLHARGEGVVLVARDLGASAAASARQRRAERLEAIGVLAAGLAHEIRNPLNGAQLHLTLLKRSLKRSGDDDASEAAEVVSGELKRLAQLVSDFLEFARPYPLEQAPNDLKVVCQRAVAQALQRPNAAGVEVTAALPESEIVAEVDAKQLVRALSHLLNNGIDAVAEQSGVVNLRVTRQPRSVTILVEDNGSAEIDLSMPIFDAFFSTKPNAAGLGLAVAHRIVKDHGGSLAAERNDGQTQLRMRLPLTETDRFANPSLGDES